MCKRCIASELGRARQQAYDDARAAVQAAGLYPALAGFLSRYGARRDQGGRPGAPLYTPAEQALLDRFTEARAALKQLHNDYIWAATRAEVARARAARAAD